jgi:hypothetical protein
MLIKQATAVVSISILLLIQVTICGANSEEKIISSAEEIVSFWENSLSNKLDILIYNPEMDYWHVNRIVLVNQSFDFETIQTDSIATPCQLIIRLSFNRWHNRLSPNANSEYEYENRIWGFKSADEALANTGKSDFEEADYSYIEKISRKMTMIYVLKNEAWILEGGNDLFETYIGQHIADMNNAHLFKNVLSVPIK